VNNETTKVKVAGATIGGTAGGTALTFLVTAGELDPFVQNIIAVVLSMVLLMHAISLLITAANYNKVK
jgi:hypothetical protein